MERDRQFEINIDRICQRLSSEAGRPVTKDQAAAYLVAIGFKREASRWTGPALLALELRGDEYCIMPESKC